MAIWIPNENTYAFSEEENKYLSFFRDSSPLESAFRDLIRECIITYTTDKNKNTYPSGKTGIDTRRYAMAGCDVRDFLYRLTCDVMDIHFSKPIGKLFKLPYRTDTSETVRRNYMTGGSVLRIAAWAVTMSHEHRNDVSDIKDYCLTYKQSTLLQPKWNDPTVVKEKWNEALDEIECISSATREKFRFDGVEYKKSTTVEGAPAKKQEQKTEKVINATVVDNKVVEDHPRDDVPFDDQEHVMVPAVADATVNVFSNTPNTSDEIHQMKQAMAADIDPEPELEPSDGVKVPEAVVVEEDHKVDPAPDTIEVDEKPEAPQELPEANIKFGEYNPMFDMYKQQNDAATAIYPDLIKLTRLLNNDGIYIIYMADPVNPGYVACTAYIYENGMRRNLTNFFVDPRIVTGFMYRVVTFTRKDHNLYRETYIPITKQNEGYILRYVKTGTLPVKDRMEINKTCKCLSDVISKVDMSMMNRYVVNRKEWEATMFTINNILRNKNLPKVRWRIGYWRSRNEFELAVDEYVRFQAWQPYTDEDMKLQDIYRKLGMRITYNPSVYEDYGYMISYGNVQATKDNIAEIAHVLGFEPYAGIAKLHTAITQNLKGKGKKPEKQPVAVEASAATVEEKPKDAFEEIENDINIANAFRKTRAAATT